MCGEIGGKVRPNNKLDGFVEDQMITYRVIVAMTNLFQIDIESSEGLEYSEIKRRACEKARRRNGPVPDLKVEEHKVFV